MSRRSDNQMLYALVALMVLFVGSRIISNNGSDNYGINIVDSTQQKMLDNNTGSDELIRLNKECLIRIDRLNSQIEYLTKAEDEPLPSGGNFDWGLLLIASLICASVGYVYGRKSELSSLEGTINK